MPEISPKALVANPAGLADDVQVGAFSVIGPHVTVAAGTIIANNVTLLGRTTIGPGCRLFPGCVVGAAPPGCDRMVEDAAGPCVLGARNTVREHAVIYAGEEPAGRGTWIGDKNLIMASCQVEPDATLDGEGIFPNFTRIERRAHVEKFVRTSGFTTVGACATVGAYTLTTGYVEVDRDAPPYAIVHGSPFRIRGVNAENLRRCHFPPETIAGLKAAFRALFEKDVPFPDESVLRAVEARYNDEHVRILIASLRHSAVSATGRMAEASPTGEAAAS